jgi:type II secretory pathway pseudopilin PulG
MRPVPWIGWANTLERSVSVSRSTQRAAPAVAVLAIAAGGAVWSGCGSSDSNSVTDQVESAKTEANEVIDKAQKQGNEAIDKAQKQLNESDIPKQAQDKVNEANKKLEEAQGKVNEASKQAKKQLNESGY